MEPPGAAFLSPPKPQPHPPVKNTLVVTVLFITAGVPLTFAAQLAGIVTVTSTFVYAAVGCFIAAGVLAIAFADYSRASHYKLNRMPKSAPQGKPAVVSTPAPAIPEWAYRTLSA